MKPNEEEEDSEDTFFNVIKKFSYTLALKPQRPYLDNSYISKTEHLGWGSARHDGVYRNRSIPENEYQALMETMPHEEPKVSKKEIEEKNDKLIIAVQEAFFELTEEEQWLYQMFVEVGLSLRFLGLVINMPKTTLARRRDELSRKLKSLLLKQPEVREYLLESNIISSSDTPT